MTDYQRYSPSGLERARGFGLSLPGTPGPNDSIVDVPGLEMGLKTIIRGTSVRTGVTGIFPRGKDRVGDPVLAGFHSQNGNGEMTGISWINESGTFSGPIAITNTHAVGIAHAGIIAWTVANHPQLAEAWLLPVVSETWDGYLNDINSHPVEEADVIECLDAASSLPFEEGSVGGGTGMNCYEFKGGSGTASRVVELSQGIFTVGVFVQANFGAREELVIGGVSVGSALDVENPMARHFTLPPGSGSCVAIVATDAPLLPHQCAALARRVTIGLARTGTTGSHFSGDLFLAFSTANPDSVSPSWKSLYNQGSTELDHLNVLPWGAMDPMFAATAWATEEAVLNALLVNSTMVGRDGHVSPELPRDRLRGLLGVS